MSNQENVINTKFKSNFQNSSPKVRSQSISSRISHSSNSISSRSSTASLAELEIKKQWAEIRAHQKKESHKRKIKLLERQKGTRATNGERKGIPRISGSAEQP